MSVLVVLEKYVGRLREAESKKPVQLRHFVPTIKELCEVSGASESNFNRFLNNKHRGINRDYVYTSLQLLNARGFPTTFDDILEYIPNGEPRTDSK